MREGLMTEVKRAIGAIRVSSVKQGTEGDSPEAQREQIERFAQNKNITIDKYFVFLESASREQQPMQEAIDYCKNPKNKIDFFIIKSIDRFTRAGSLSYGLLKTQLDNNDVKLLDIYGIISSQTINTLEHLEVEYDWSKYSPTKKTEILEAERSKDEVRDILSRLVGSAIRYARLGYWMRPAPYGYESQKIDTEHGKRSVLIPHPQEAVFIRKMFELRAGGRYTDSEIAEKLNAMGYHGRGRRNDPPGTPLQARHLWNIVRKTIYAGINSEKWTNGQPVRFTFEGLVSVDLFNRANKGRRRIQINGQNIKVIDTVEERYTVKHGARDGDFPYRKYVLCSVCRRPLIGSASTGRSGKKYPAYHCTKHDHNFRVSKQNLEAAVNGYVASLQISPKLTQKLLDETEAALAQSLTQRNSRSEALGKQIKALEAEMDQVVGKLKLLSNPVALKCMEEELGNIQTAIDELNARKKALSKEKTIDFNQIRQRLKFLAEHFNQLLIHQSNPLEKARLFGLLFHKLPTYQDLLGGTAQNGKSHQLNPVFEAIGSNLSFMAHREGFEPPTHGSEDRCSNPLSYRCLHA